MFYSWTSNSQFLNAYPVPQVLPNEWRALYAEQLSRRVIARFNVLDQLSAAAPGSTSTSSNTQSGEAVNVDIDEIVSNHSIPIQQLDRPRLLEILHLLAPFVEYVVLEILDNSI